MLSLDASDRFLFPFSTIWPDLEYSTFARWSPVRMVAPDSKQLLQELLSPLLEDFHYWFGKSITLLEDNRIEFLSQSDQTDLLERVRTALAELQSAEQLYNLSDCSVGIDPKLVVQWHRLLLECGGVGQKFRRLKAEQANSVSTDRNRISDSELGDASTG